MENKSVVKVNSNTPADMIRMAVEGKADLAQLRELLALQKDWEANEARKSFHAAMAEFKANPPKIDKDKAVAYGNTKYNHASLANVTEKIGAELSKHGLSASWSTKQNGQICVTCRITHVQGHSEETMLCAASDTSGSKNAIQAIGSTITYLERYTLLALTGLATYEQEDDGQAAATEYIDAAQVSLLIDSLAALEASIPSFLKYMKVESLEKMTKADLPKAQAAIEAKKAKAKK